MTRDEIVKVLAERDGWTNFHERGNGIYGSMRLEDGSVSVVPQCKVGDYCTRDAIALVVEKMTEEEREVFVLHLQIKWDHADSNCEECWLLTCDPSVIAECAARAIVECKEKA